MGIRHIRADPGALAAQDYTVAFSSFAPLVEDVFIAAGDGSDPVPLAPHPALDYNASFSADGGHVFFTSEREGSARSLHGRAGSAAPARDARGRQCEPPVRRLRGHPVRLHSLVFFHRVEHLRPVIAVFVQLPFAGSGRNYAEHPAFMFFVSGLTVLRPS